MRQLEESDPGPHGDRTDSQGKDNVTNSGPKVIKEYVKH